MCGGGGERVDGGDGVFDLGGAKLVASFGSEELSRSRSLGVTVTRAASKFLQALVERMGPGLDPVIE